MTEGENRPTPGGLSRIDPAEIGDPPVTPPRLRQLNSPTESEKERDALKNKLLSQRARAAPWLFGAALLLLFLAVGLAVSTLQDTSRPTYAEAYEASRGHLISDGPAVSVDGKPVPFTFEQRLKRDALLQKTATKIHESELENQASRLVVRALLIFSLFGVSAALLRSFNVLTREPVVPTRGAVPTTSSWPTRKTSCSATVKGRTSSPCSLR